jgi:hypothetical protein
LTTCEIRASEARHPGYCHRTTNTKGDSHVELAKLCRLHGGSRLNIRLDEHGGMPSTLAERP